MLNLLYSQLSLTRKSSIIPERVVTVKSEEDLKNLSEAVGRYEYSRGSEGKIIADLTRLRGVEETDDRLRILAGTPWREVINRKPEIFGNLDFSVGGSVEYGDAGFGFYEFRFIKDRVEVEAYLNGNKYIGKYKGGIIYAVLVRKENREIVTKSYETKDFDELYYMIKAWFSLTLPPFRDVTIQWKDERFTLTVSYTKLRENFLTEFVKIFHDGKILYEDSSFPHKYRYFGQINFSDLLTLKDRILKSKQAFIRVGLNKVYFSIYSDTFLSFPEAELSPLSDTIEENRLNGCIMCGKCVEVCPYSEYKGSLVYSPLGFYTLQALGSAVQINCHMCGKCVEVCPAKLGIISDISKTVTYDIQIEKGKKVKELNYKRKIVITPLSSGLEERLLKALLYLYSKGSIVGVKYLDINIQDLVLGKVDWKEIAKQFVGVSQIITITPEEYYYLQPLKRYVILDINYIEEYTIAEQEIKEELHVPCYLRGIKKESGKCSYAFLDILNKTNAKSEINAKVTLCPFTAKKLNIVTPLDLLIPRINKEAVKLIASKIKKNLENSSRILEDAKWYMGVADTLYEELSNKLYDAGLRNLQPEELLTLYFYLDAVEDFTEDEKKILEEKIPKFILK